MNGDGRNHLYLWEARLLYATHGYVSRDHRHFAVTLVIAPDDTARIRLDNKVDIRHKAILVASNQLFSISAELLHPEHGGDHALSGL